MSKFRRTSAAVLIAATFAAEAVREATGGARHAAGSATVDRIVRPNDYRWR